MILIYSLVINFFYPIIILVIYFRSLINKEDKIRYKEKLFISKFNPDRNLNKKLIWFHAASLGEIKSVLPLLKKLNKNQKEIEFLITTITTSSANFVSKELYKYKNINHRYLPIDKKTLVTEFLNNWSPNLAIFVDSEVWPNFIYEIKNMGIPLILLNARITSKSFNRWKYFSRFSSKIFGSYDLCLTSSLDTKKKLENLNAKNIKFLGNIKFSSDNEIQNIENKNKNILKKYKTWCAASLHRGEEELCINAHIKVNKAHKNLLTILIPRHINNVKKIYSITKRYQLNTQILNSKENIKKNLDILIVNSFGVLNKYFNYCDFVFMGKSFLKKFEYNGGQNPIEAAKFGCKIFHGPYTYNFQEVYKLLNSYSITETVKDDKQLSIKLDKAFKNKKILKNKNIKKINNYGKKILDTTIKEITKFL